MPGLTQLKEFSKNLLSLGQEASLRASRGEKPVTVEIPSSIPDVDDSDDFVIGMPEKEAEVEPEAIDDDLSELTGMSSAPTAKKSETSEDDSSAFAAPDMSDLLAPMGAGEDSDGQMPDLSMFMDEPETVEEESEPEPEEVSLADMSLEDLLAGGGFDEASEESEEESEDSLEEAEPFAESQMVEQPIESFDDVENLDDSEIVEDAEVLDEAEDIEEAEPLEDGDTFGEVESLAEAEPQEATEPFGEAEPLDDLDSLTEEAPSEAASPLDDLGSLDDMPSLDDMSFDTPSLNNAEESNQEPLSDAENLESAEAEGSEAAENLESAEDSQDSAAQNQDTFGIEDFGFEDFDYSAPEEKAEDTAAEADNTVDAATDSGDFSDLNSAEVDNSDLAGTGLESADLDTGADFDATSALGDMADLDAPADLSDLPDLDAPADLGDMPDLDSPADLDASAELDAPADLGDLSDLDAPADLGDKNIAADLGDTPDLDSPADLDADSDFDASSALGDMADLDAPSDLGDMPDLDSPADLDASADLDAPTDLGDLSDLDAPADLDTGADFDATSASGDMPDLDAPADLGDIPDLDSPADLDASADLDAPADLGDLSDLDAPADLDAGSDFDATSASDDMADLDAPAELGDMPDLDAPADLDASADLDSPADLGDMADLDVPTDLSDIDIAADLGDTPDLNSPADLDADSDFDASSALGDMADLDAPADLGDIPDLDALADLDASADLDSPADLDDLSDVDAPADLDTGADLDAPADLGDMPDLDSPADLDASADLDAPTDLGDLSDLDAPADLDTDADLDSPQPSAFDASDLDLPSDLDASTDFDTPEESNSSTEDFGDSSGLDASETIEDTEESAFDLPDMDMDAGDFGGGDSDSAGDFDDSGAPPEIFDTSDIEGLDFGITETDDHINGGDFELGNSDDFAMEGEFEIPGFSDVDTAKEEKKSKPAAAAKGKRSKGKNLPEPDFTGAEEGDTLPPNTLSDAQYQVFLKNLSEYPLNVRLAFEDLIVQDEFTDDAEFEIIEKILNKAPARQVASLLEKMLDISIPVPRDFEHRTADEYEAYKKSLSYQLRNKIIPAALIGAVSLLVLWGLFNFSKNCIYKPLKANSLYKQGYQLLEADEYPQSEMKFNEAITYRISKKWFFNYARGYRSHKQYQRAGNMYQNILKCFRHDKPAGLEYADMELNDMANYPRAEEIVRREVLDYHINDKDGILMLGDIFLEWATDKDPSKFELAREQYATLIQLYEPSDLYKSRMMRYFIRTDNLREVLQLKPDFESRDKSLCAEDWAELSGYLLDKYYGPMDPSEEYLRYEIEGLRGLLLKAVKANPENPIAYYNLAKYFINTNEAEMVEQTLQHAIEKFNLVPSMKNRDVYKYIDSYRLLGEHYMSTTDYLQAQEQFAEGISLYTTERDNAGFEGTPSIGKLYEDMGNIKYSISGDYDEALLNYKYSVELENDSPSLRYRIGFIQYKKNNYQEALGAFMKAGDGNIKERNLQLAMANTLFMRGDVYAAQGYYNQLIDHLDAEIAEEGIVFPQTNINDYDTVNTYLYAANNYGVTLYKLAKRTGNSALNAQAIVQFSQSVRAWDALTRNQDSLLRLPGSNLAEQNIKYIASPIPNFEPSIYIDIPRTLTNNERL